VICQDRLPVDVSQLISAIPSTVRDIQMPSGVTAKVPLDLTAFSVLAPVVEEEPVAVEAEAARPQDQKLSPRRKKRAKLLAPRRCKGKGSKGKRAKEVAFLSGSCEKSRSGCETGILDLSGIVEGKRHRFAWLLGWETRAGICATRHNIGFMVADQLAAQFGSTWEKSTKWDALMAKCSDVFVAKPMSYMNRSGYPLLK
jgi:hypothetical protein